MKKLRTEAASSMPLWRRLLSWPSKDQETPQEEETPKVRRAEARPRKSESHNRKGPKP